MRATVLVLMLAVSAGAETFRVTPVASDGEYGVQVGVDLLDVSRAWRAFYEAEMRGKGAYTEEWVSFNEPGKLYAEDAHDTGGQVVSKTEDKTLAEAGAGWWERNWKKVGVGAGLLVVGAVGKKYYDDNESKDSKDDPPPPPPAPSASGPGSIAANEEGEGDLIIIIDSQNNPS